MLLQRCGNHRRWRAGRDAEAASEGDVAGCAAEATARSVGVPRVLERRATVRRPRKKLHVNISLCYLVRKNAEYSSIYIAIVEAAIVSFFFDPAYILSLL